MKDNQQLVYDKLFTISEKLGFNTYDFLPREEVPYPFVYMGQSRIAPRGTKSRILGRIYIDIDIYGKKDDRAAVSSMLKSLFNQAANIDIEGLILVADECDYRLMQDQSTAVDLWHGILSLVFRF